MLSGPEIPHQSPSGAARPTSASSRILTQAFLMLLGVLLVGYMFLGRGFAHIGIGPIFVGDAVLILGVAVTAYVMLRERLRPAVSWTIGLLVGFAILGAARTMPYLGVYGLDALRDGVLWGYAGFALIVYILVGRESLVGGFRAYGWIIPAFALWLPIGWEIFRNLSLDIDPTRPGSFVPLIVFKAGDMAVHVVGAIAFLILGAKRITSSRGFLWRTILFLPLLWTVFVAGTLNRGALLTALAGIVAVAVLAPRARNWRPFFVAIAIGLAAVLAQTAIVTLWPQVPAGGRSAGTVATQPTSPAAPASRELEDRSHAADASASPAGSGTPGADLGELAIANPDFELGLGDTGAPEGWTPRGAEVSLVHGSGYRESTFASISNPLGPYQATLTSDRFRFEGGPDLRVSAWAMAIRGRPAVEIYVNWYDRSGSLISSAFVAAAASDGARSWNEFGGAVPVPDEATQAEILLYERAGRATVGIDEISVRSGDFIAEPAAPEGRPATLFQVVENILSLFGSSPDPGLEGTKQFRLAWWGEIVDYTFFGDRFWTGQGFGINLADADGFQSTADGSLRAPHNSHLTVLARMGVPGFVVWVALQAAFGLTLLRAMLHLRRSGELQLAAVGGWVLAYWFAMMVDTSFDPYLEGPQGGIWFWVIVGLGLVVIRLSGRPARA